jgi:hypothetical protein
MGVGFLLLTGSAQAENQPPDPRASKALMQHLSDRVEAHHNSNRLSAKAHKALQLEIVSLTKSLKSFGDSAFDEPFGSCFQAGRIWIEWAERRLQAVYPLEQEVTAFRTWKTACDKALEGRD